MIPLLLLILCFSGCVYPKYNCTHVEAKRACPECLAKEEYYKTHKLPHNTGYVCACSGDEMVTILPAYNVCVPVKEAK